MSHSPIATIAQRISPICLRRANDSEALHIFAKYRLFAVIAGIAFVIFLSASSTSAQYEPPDDSLPAPFFDGECDGDIMSGTRVVASWWMNGIGEYGVNGNTSGTVEKHSWVSDIDSPRPEHSKYVWIDFLGRTREGGQYTQRLYFTVDTAWGVHSRISKECVVRFP